MCRAEEGRPAEVCRKIQVSVADLSLDIQILQDVLRMLRFRSLRADSSMVRNHAARSGGYIGGHHHDGQW